MPKLPDTIPSKSLSIPVTGDHLETLNAIVAESRRLKPTWQDNPQSVLVSIVEDFLEQPDAFDQFVLIRVNDEQRALLRQIAELKALKQAVKAGTLEDDGPTAALNPLPNLGSVSPTVDKSGR